MSHAFARRDGANQREVGGLPQLDMAVIPLAQGHHAVARAHAADRPHGGAPVLDAILLGTANQVAIGRGEEGIVAVNRHSFARVVRIGSLRV